MDEFTEIMKKTSIIGQLRTNFLFISLNDEELAKMAGRFETVDYDVGEAIVTQGMPL